MKFLKHDILVFLTFGFFSITRVHCTNDSLSNVVVNRGCCQCKFNDTLYTHSACGKYKPLMTLVQSLMMARCDVADPCRRLGKDAPPKQEWFDFIVVGAGVAGPIIARRLSDHNGWRVLLVEAGPEEPTFAAIPGLAFNSINSELDWRYRTEPTQPHPTACLATGGRCSWPRGKMISGTSGMNGMMYVRGSPSVYDEWGKYNPGWKYSEIETYFERAENPVDPAFVTEKIYKNINTGAPLIVDRFNDKPDFANELLMAASEMGYRTSGLRGNQHTGFMVAPMLTDNGLRGTTAKYYLRPVMGRPNLYVMTNAQVTKILTEGWGKRAYGVELIDSEGKKRKFMTNKEIILTAGAVGSPQILLQSGIGPRDDLQKLGIPVIRDLPVGKILQNHVSIGIKISIKDNVKEALTIDSVNEFIANRTGRLSSTGLTQVTAFLESTYAPQGVPDIQVFFDGFSSNCVRNDCDGKNGTCANRRELVARPTALLTRSRGYLKLKSTNPLEHPLIYPNYFTDTQDLEVLVQGIRKIVQLTKTKAMTKWDMRLDTKPVPACNGYRFGTDAYWRCYVRQQTGPENHQAGSCRMGPANDSQSVVDAKLRVHGVPNIRVADASIFPMLINANPVAPIVMVAEKASDMIYQQWSNVPKNVNSKNSNKQQS